MFARTQELVRRCSWPAMGRILPDSKTWKKDTAGLCYQCCRQVSSGRKKAKPEGGGEKEEELSGKDLALQQALDQITEAFGKGSIMWLGRSSYSVNVPVISTGSIGLDVALGTGGLPRGRVVEIYGPEASGKTTLALHVIAEAQKQGGYCVFVDAEHALDPTLAVKIGVNTHNLLLSQPDCGEQALGLVDTIIRSGSVDVVVVDSVAALVPKSELDGEMGDAHMAMQARLMSQALRKLSHSISQSQTLLIFVNQVRSRLATFGFGGSVDVTCGGNALKFYASVRLHIKRTGYVKRGDQTLGTEVQVKVVKNKLAPPFRTANFELEFGRGISPESELIHLGCAHNLVRHASSYYHFNQIAFHGKDAFKRYLFENLAVRDDLRSTLMEKIMLSGAAAEPAAELDALSDHVVAPSAVT